jgi:hypothetical protein
MPVINPKTGKEFRWARHRWTPRTRARWHKKTMYGDPVIGSVRAIAHLDYLDRRAKAIFGVGITVVQSAYNTSVAASAGTHNEDLVYDLWIFGVSGYRQQHFFRAHGFPGWYRPTTPGLWKNHYHGWSAVPYGVDVSKSFAEHGFKVGVYIDGGWSTYGRLVTSSQAHDQLVHAFGLKDQHTPGSDKSWYPDNPKGHIFDLHGYIVRRTRVQAAA